MNETSPQQIAIERKAVQGAKKAILSGDKPDEVGGILREGAELTYGTLESERQSVNAKMGLAEEDARREEGHVMKHVKDIKAWWAKRQGERDIQNLDQRQQSIRALVTDIQGEIIKDPDFLAIELRRARRSAEIVMGIAKQLVKEGGTDNQPTRRDYAEASRVYDAAVRQIAEEYDENRRGIFIPNISLSRSKEPHTVLATPKIVNRPQQILNDLMAGAPLYRQGEFHGARVTFAPLDRLLNRVNIG